MEIRAFLKGTKTAKFNPVFPMFWLEFVCRTIIHWALADPCDWPCICLTQIIVLVMYSSHYCILHTWSSQNSTPRFLFLPSFKGRPGNDISGLFYFKRMTSSAWDLNWFPGIMYVPDFHITLISSVMPQSGYSKRQRACGDELENKENPLTQ